MAAVLDRAVAFDITNSAVATVFNSTIAFNIADRRVAAVFNSAIAVNIALWTMVTRLNTLGVTNCYAYKCQNG
ncbi:hypothetical protein D3C80_2162500 [compost metagenome]